VTPWATPDALREIWADAPESPRLDNLALAAQEVLEAYAPALKLDDLGAPIVPRRYVEALALQCREVWGAGQRDGDFLIGDADYAVRLRFVSDAVRGLLRPRNPRPRFGRPAVAP
jgi:hypothetical protein